MSGNHLLHFLLVIQPPSHVPRPKRKQEKQQRRVIKRIRKEKKEIERITKFFLQKYLHVFYVQFFQVNVVSYKARPNAKDFIQIEILVEKHSQKIILIGRVCHLYLNSVNHQWNLFLQDIVQWHYYQCYYFYSDFMAFSLDLTLIFSMTKLSPYVLIYAWVLTFGMVCVYHLKFLIFCSSYA